MNEVEVVVVELYSAREFVGFSEDEESQYEEHEEDVQIIVQKGLLKIENFDIIDIVEGNDLLPSIPKAESQA